MKKWKKKLMMIIVLNYNHRLAAEVSVSLTSLDNSDASYPINSRKSQTNL